MKSQGVRKGDVVTLYMPMIPELGNSIEGVTHLSIVVFYCMLLCDYCCCVIVVFVLCVSHDYVGLCAYWSCPLDCLRWLLGRVLEGAN